MAAAFDLDCTLAALADPTRRAIIGAERIALGSDYPFPLGEHHPGKLIESMDFDQKTKDWLLADTALRWLDLKRSDYEK